jgi:hypothetical protein
MINKIAVEAAGEIWNNGSNAFGRTGAKSKTVFPDKIGV